MGAGNARSSLIPHVCRRVQTCGPRARNVREWHKDVRLAKVQGPPVLCTPLLCTPHVHGCGRPARTCALRRFCCPVRSTRTFGATARPHSGRPGPVLVLPTPSQKPCVRAPVVRFPRVCRTHARLSQVRRPHAVWFWGWFGVRTFGVAKRWWKSFLLNSHLEHSLRKSSLRTTRP